MSLNTPNGDPVLADGSDHRLGDLEHEARAVFDATPVSIGA